MRHVLTNVLGGSNEQVEVDVDLLRLEDGDRLLLCSDGLTDLVDDDTIAKTLVGDGLVRRRLRATGAARARSAAAATTSP